jgi:quaternary ammonium compound-resistance protein SugE
MSWFYLIIAGLFEIGWPLGLKLSQTMSERYPGIVLAVVSMSLSGLFLWLAQKSIPIGTAYAVWTGIGAVGTLLVGIVFFGDSAGLWRMLSVLLIVVGIFGLKVAH